METLFLTRAIRLRHDRRFESHDGSVERGPTVIIGAGLAGLSAALRLAPAPVVVVSAAPVGEGCASAWAQGGVAAAVGPDDSVASHIADTIAAGNGLVDPRVAELVARDAPERVFDLANLGVAFDTAEDGAFRLSREAAHSKNRIVRVCGDRSGAAIMSAVVKKVRATSTIELLEGYVAYDLVVKRGRVCGVRVRPNPGAGAGAGASAGARALTLKAGAVVLAAGGVGALYSVTTNPEYSAGGAIAMAARAGATISDSEFVQFHPTALDFGVDPAPLATEALRGEGAVLVERDGKRFMPALHKDGELAPRDIVARGVFAQIQNGRGAFLDCRDAIGPEFPQRFPTVFEASQRAGVDPVRQPLPVVPAAHYHMGGIATDLCGRSDVAGLWAIGEAAATGLHGANRLASNSLLETLVFGARAGQDILDHRPRLKTPEDVLPGPSEPIHVVDDLHFGLPATDRAIRELRNVMSRYVGVIRSRPGLQRALRALALLEREFGGDPVFANSVLAAQVITASALMRNESRGAHFRSDFPNEVTEAAQRSYITLRDVDALVYAALPTAHVPSFERSERQSSRKPTHENVATSA